MPSFIGQPLGSVTQTLQDAGLRVGTVTPVTSPESIPSAGPPVPPPFAPSHASVIVSQNPGAGEKVTVGAAVNFGVR